MVASNEWETQYLTKDGWVTGGYKLDHGKKKEDIPPEGAVLRAYRKVTVGKLGAPSSMNVDESQSELTKDQDLINTLLNKFGQPQFGV
ncbi:hypothetical protein L2725_16670 [Shewanella corallii]|uniref:Uncharacterized protein n=1 Tax=Shewanella corallii TaxID=560080 RepID=A0ABT0NAE8_9GAMM|nr:hypothetical protein [Shewanella corallii]MCL2915389.1 hypothetical protein [Shewanella corallii]